jgi:hypothetical protein
MGFSRQHAGLVLAAAALAAVGLACSLNPQPLPPDSPTDAGYSNANPPPTTGGGSPDAAQTPRSDGGSLFNPDGGGVPPAVDAGAVDAASDALDASPDAEVDAEPEDAAPESGSD